MQLTVPCCTRTQSARDSRSGVTPPGDTRSPSPNRHAPLPSFFCTVFQRKRGVVAVAVVPSAATCCERVELALACLALELPHLFA